MKENICSVLLAGALFVHSGVCAIQIHVDPAYEIANGMSGMMRDINIRLMNMMWFSPEVRSMIGMSREHFLWKNHLYFIEPRCLSEANCLRISKYKDLSIKTIRKRMKELLIADAGQMEFETLVDAYKKSDPATRLDKKAWEQAFVDKLNLTNLSVSNRRQYVRLCPPSMIGVMWDIFCKSDNYTAINTRMFMRKQIAAITDSQIIRFKQAMAARLLEKSFGQILNSRQRKAIACRIKATLDLYREPKLRKILSEAKDCEGDKVIKNIYDHTIEDFPFIEMANILAKIDQDHDGNFLTPYQKTAITQRRTSVFRKIEITEHEVTREVTREVKIAFAWEELLTDIMNDLVDDWALPFLD